MKDSLEKYNKIEHSFNLKVGKYLKYPLTRSKTVEHYKMVICMLSYIALLEFNQ